MQAGVFFERRDGNREGLPRLKGAFASSHGSADIFSLLDQDVQIMLE